MAEELVSRSVTPPGGRNKRHPGGRQNTVKARMNNDELAKVKARAAVLGISTPRTLIEAATGVPEFTKTERHAILHELLAVRRLLARMGNNVNQIAKALNSDAVVPGAQIAATLTAATRAAERAEEAAQRIAP